MRVALTVLILAFACAPTWALTNLIVNPGLETDANGDGIADGWSSQIHTAEGAQGGFALDTTERRAGATSQRIDHTNAGSAWVRVSQEPIRAIPGGRYKLSLWVKVAAPACIYLYEYRRGGLPVLTAFNAPLTIGDAWQQFTRTFTAGPDASYFKLSVIAQGQGSLWLDDVSLILLGERPHLKVPRAASAPVIDGDLSDDAWRGAQRVEGFLALGADGAEPPVQTSAAVMSDDQALYVAFTCPEPNIAGLRRDSVTDDGGVWADDCVEVFLDTEKDEVGYVHLGVGAGGGKAAERRPGRQFYVNWYSSSTQALREPQWLAATKVGNDLWTAEIRLPFDQVGEAPKPGKVWGVQLCRTRRAGGKEENSTWTYTDGDKYARPELFGSLVFTAGAGAPPTPVTRAVQPEESEPIIVPRPVSVQWQAGALRIPDGCLIRVATLEQRPEADILATHLRSRYGLTTHVVVGDEAAPALFDLAAVPDERTPVNPEGYRLEVGPRVLLSTHGDRGRLYGVQTLLQMLIADPGGVAVRCAQIVDEPSMGFRAWHMASPSEADLPTYRRMVDVLAALKYNAIVWEVNEQLQYETHPDIARAGAPTKAQLKDLVAYAKLRRFEVIPQLATFAHFGYALQRPAYKGLAESQQTTQGIRSLFNYCPSNPATYDLVFDLMGEVAEVFEPRYFHIGHDEASFDDIGVCDRCKGTDPWVLWARDINKLDAWIKARGMRTVMWGDQFLPQHNGDKPFFTARATDMIPKDILIFDWHYSPNHKYDETIGYFREHGFEVVGCPWYEPVNVYAFASAAKRNGILGYCGTTWARVPSTMASQPQLPAAWVIGAENSWSTDAPPLGEVAYAPVAQFNRLWRLNQPELPRQFRMVDIGPYCNERTVDNERREGWMGLGTKQDLRSLPSGTVWVGDIPFQIADRSVNAGRDCVMLAGDPPQTASYPEAIYEIAIGAAARSVYLLQTCSVPATRERILYATKNPGVIGHYVVNYADGQATNVPLRYLANIHDWNGQCGPAQALGVWQGHTEGGSLISIGAVEWVNPRPEVPIRSFDFVSDLGGARPVLLAVTLSDR
jgi:hexosaminidase